MRNREEKKFDTERETFRNKDGVFKVVGVLTPDVVKQLTEDFAAFKGKFPQCETVDLTIDKVLIRFNNGVLEEREFTIMVKDLIWNDQFKLFFWNAPGGLLRPKSPVQFGFYHPRSKGGDGKKTNVHDFNAIKAKVGGYEKEGKGGKGSGKKGGGGKNSKSGGKKKR